MSRTILLALCLLCLVVSMLGGAAAAGIVAGPVEVEVVRVIDGDTFVAAARIWPGHVVTVSVRVRGIDAPEMRSRCKAEKAAARRARAALARLLGDGPARISNIGGGKYHGRVLADVETAQGRDVAPAMLHLGLARAYDGKRRQPMC